MVAVRIKKTKHNMFCVTVVYSGDVTNTIFVNLRLNVSRLSACSYSLLLLLFACVLMLLTVLR